VLDYPLSIGQLYLYEIADVQKAFI
jgi:hypothetical protein